MAKARVELICTDCGKEFWAEKTCCNRTQADNWENYMKKTGGQCKECWAKQQAKKRAAEIENQAKINAEDAQGCPFALPGLQGSEKQIKWATDLRNGVLAILNGRKIKWDVLMAEAEKGNEKAKTELAKLLEPSAKVWIDNRGQQYFGICGRGY